VAHHPVPDATEAYPADRFCHCLLLQFAFDNQFIMVAMT
jgi:hypothetical protein